MTAQIVTANRLTDGLVVFLGYDGEWSKHIDDARVAERDDDIADLIGESERATDVVGPYPIDVEVRSHETAAREIWPTRYRERIRAFGPSVHPAFARKPVADHFDPRADASSIFMNGI